MCEVSVVLRSSKEIEAVYRPDTVPVQDHAMFNISPATSGPSCWSELPSDILVQILQHVPVQPRFKSCALVSMQWASAAVLATDSITLPRRCYHMCSLQSWLAQHGASITTISLIGNLDHDMTLLPCSNLLQLDLAEVAVQLSPQDCRPYRHLPGILKECTQLTRFTLRHAAVVGGPDALTGLAPLSRLQHLALSDLDTKQFPAASIDWFPVPGSLCSQLVALTHLELDRCVSASTLEHLSCLSSLQSLLLGRLLQHHVTAAALSGLEHLMQLRWLLIEGLESHISTSSMPSIGQLTKLTRLQLLNCKGFQPILLSGMLQLQVLDMQGTPLLGTGGVVDAPAAAPAAGGQLQAAAGVNAAAGAGVAGAPGNNAAAPGNNAAAGAADPAAAAAAADQGVTQAAAQAAAGAAALLLELPKLQQLRQLTLVQVLWAHAAGLPSAAYAALTASSKLQQLDLSFSLIPAAAWRAAFDPHMQCLSNLTTLNILCSQAHITDADLERVVWCCPGLRALGLKGSLEQGLELSALLGFGGLTSLSLNHVQSNKALWAIAQLRGLQDLQMSVLSSIRASGLLQLSSLKALTRLRVESSPETWIAKYGLVLFDNKAPPDSPPDVCQQLEHWCLRKMADMKPAEPEEQQQQRRKKGGLLRWLVPCVGGE